jgi:uncharacterized protein (DUF58 family)
LKSKHLPHPKLSSRLLPILVGFVLVMEAIDPSQIWLSLMVGLGLFWLAAYLWARGLAASLDVRREMRFGWTQVGDALEERFTIINQGWIPAPWVEIIDHSDMPGYNASQVRGTDPGSSNTWRTRGFCTQRGLFTLGPTTLRTGDPFGIYRVEKSFPAFTNLLVMPPVVPLPAIDVAPGGHSGEGRPRRDAPERTVSASTVREYSPGDSLHLIHWKTTARRDDFFVKMFDGTPAGDWWIVLDLDQQVQAGAGWDSTVEHSIILAASLADHGLRLRRAVGLVVNGGQLGWLPPHQGSHRRFEILRTLALAEPGSTPLANLLEKTKESIERRSSLVIITPNPGQDWIQSLVSTMRRGIAPTVLLLNPTEWLTTGQEADAVDGKIDSQRSVTKQHLATVDKLARLGISRYSIPRQLFDRPEARPGQEGQVKWRITPRGRAVAINKTAETAWKTLS